MDRLIVDFGELRLLVNGIDKRIADIDSLVDSLGKHIASLTELWQGGASDGFRRTQAGWLAAASDLRIRLVGLRDLVVTAHDNHARAVRSNVGIWRV